MRGRRSGLPLEITRIIPGTGIDFAYGRLKLKPVGR